MIAKHHVKVVAIPEKGFTRRPSFMASMASVSQPNMTPWPAVAASRHSEASKKVRPFANSDGQKVHNPTCGEYNKNASAICRDGSYSFPQRSFSRENQFAFFLTEDKLGNIVQIN